MYQLNESLVAKKWRHNEMKKQMIRVVPVSLVIGFPVCGLFYVVIYCIGIEIRFIDAFAIAAIPLFTAFIGICVFLCIFILDRLLKESIKFEDDKIVVKGYRIGSVKYKKIHSYSLSFLSNELGFYIISIFINDFTTIQIGIAKDEVNPESVERFLSAIGIKRIDRVVTHYRGLELS